MNLAELLSIINADLIEGQGHEAQELRRLLKTCEYPGFTLAQAWYWVTSDCHSGQYSPGYHRLSEISKDYTPSMSETSAGLCETDYEFEAIYNHLICRHSSGCLYL